METADRAQARPITGRQKCVAYAVHLYTASGAVVGLLMAASIVDRDYGAAFLWMLLAVAIDMTDGFLARRFRVKEVVPHIDGRTLDDLVDYLNYTFLPVCMIWRAEWLPEPGWLWCGMILMSSLFGFAHSGAKEESRGFFRGFPSYWNIVAFYIWICFHHYGSGVVLGVVLVLSLLTVLPVRFVYPNRPPCWRGFFLGGALAWMILVLYMLLRQPSDPLDWAVWVSFIYPVLYVILSVYLDWKIPREVPGERQP